jgi:hypothetical protein
MNKLPILLILPALLNSLTGCTYLRLERSLTNQATTLADLHFQQVLNNLAAFSLNPSTIPSHVSMRDGSAQIQDFGSASTSLDILHDVTTNIGLQGSRTVVEQWGVSPVTDDIELRLLRVAYQRAVGKDVSVDTDLANDIGRELSRQTAETGDVDERNEFATLNRFRDRFIDAAFEKGTFDGQLKDTDEYEELVRQALLVDAIATDRVISTNTDSIVFDDENLATLNPFLHFEPSPHGGKETRYFTPLATAVRREIKDAQQDVLKIKPGWFHVGSKRQVPKDACYVGSYTFCGKTCCAWVCPDGLEELSKFTITVAKFTSLIRERTVVTVPGGGPRFTPAPGGR